MNNSEKTKPEYTGLARRVLALERELKAMIAHTARAEPASLADLAKTFVAPIEMARREHLFTDTDSHAEDAVRGAASLVDDDDVSSIPSLQSAAETAHQPRMIGDGSAMRSQLDRVRTTFRNGIWTVVVDGAFAGDYTEREHAETAASLERRLPR